MFMYESTLTRRPLYSVSPHFNRMITGSLILNYITEGELEWFYVWLRGCMSVCVCMEGLGWDNVSAKNGVVGRREGDSRTVLEALDGD